MKKLIPIIFFVLLFIPIIFWSHTFLVGGDDSRLYYLYPYEYFKNFTFTIISDNQFGSLGFYFPQLYISFFTFFIYVLKSLFFFLNVEMLMFGINLSVGFISFYLLQRIIFPSTKDNPEIQIITSLFYVFSIFTIVTLWQSQLFSVYLISIFPLCSYFFIRGFTEKKLYFIILSSIIISLWSVLILSTPWLLAAFISLSLFIYYLFTLSNKAVFIKYSVIFFLSLLVLNIYWLAHFMYAAFSSSSKVGSIVSAIGAASFKEMNASSIRALSQNNHLFFPYFNLFDNQFITQSNSVLYNIFIHWLLPLAPFNLIFIIIICLAGFYIKKTTTEAKLYFISLLSWLLCLFFITSNIGQWGTNLFVFFNNHIPGFTMFRNMYDKFAISVTISSALLLCISLKIISQNINFLRYRIILAVLSLGLFLNAVPFISGHYFKNSIWTTKDTYPRINNLNSDYLHLTDYIRNQNNVSRYMWFPMNYLANYVQIQDQNTKNYYYSGVSPLYLFSGKTDFNGGLSFPEDKRKEIWDAINEKNYQKVGLVLQKLNVKYIIQNKNISPDLQQSYLFGREFYDLQDNDDFKKNIYGEKIKDFGNRYSIYKINSQFENEKIFITSKAEFFPQNYNSVSFVKKSSYEYSIRISNLSDTQYLVFLDPYHDLWKLYFSDGKELKTPHASVFGYANKWKIDIQKLKKDYKNEIRENKDGSMSFNLILYFQPQKLTSIFFLISGIGYAICFLYILYSFIKERTSHEK